MQAAEGVNRADAPVGEGPMPAPSSVLVRVPTRADVDRLAEINATTWRHAYAGLVPDAYLQTMEPARLRQRWLQRLADANGDRTCLAAEIGGTITSYAIGGTYRAQHDGDPREDTAGWGELFALYTDPAYQGLGAGGAVHAVLIHRLAERGFSTAALWVLESNVRAQAWYAARGWRPDGTGSQWLGAGEPLKEVRLVRRLAERLSAELEGA
ncbi:MAG: GNAT family N-acetyltransferase [Nocardioidaceae bacterium]